MGGGSGGDKSGGSSEQNDDPTSQLRALFKSKTHAEISTDMALGHTLGQGTYGRVRLSESTMVKHKIETDDAWGDDKHTPFFAIKILKKSEILRLKQVDHVKAERELLLTKVSHPFIVNAFGCYKDERNVCMITEYVPGGEVLADVRKSTAALDNDQAKFYAAQLVMALQYLHADDIVYRGLVPDNLLIDRQGYLKLIDFGFAKKVPDVTYTLCGTAEYLAPEIVNSKGHGKGADWWALGVLIYEMLAGYPPFFENEAFKIYQMVLRAQPLYPAHFDKNLYEGIEPTTGVPIDGQSRTGLITKLLQADRTRRIGCLKNGAEDIKKHRWFRGLNWAALYNKNMEPPDGVPELSGSDDHRCFPTYPDSTEESGPLLVAEKQKNYDYWTLHDPS